MEHDLAPTNVGSKPAAKFLDNNKITLFKAYLIDVTIDDHAGTPKTFTEVF